MAFLSILRKYRQDIPLGSLDTVGWVATIIVAVIAIVSWIMDVPLFWRIFVGILCIFVIVIVAYWSRTRKDNLTKEAIWNAIKVWVELPIIRFRDKKDTLPLAEKPPELADAIEECLKRGYSSIWDNRQRLRQEYLGWKNTNVSARFTTFEKGQPIVWIDAKRDYNEKTRHQLMRLHSQLAEQIKSEILAKYHTQLKC